MLSLPFFFFFNSLSFNIIFQMEYCSSVLRSRLYTYSGISFSLNPLNIVFTLNLFLNLFIYLIPKSRKWNYSFIHWFIYLFPKFISLTQPTALNFRFVYLTASLISLLGSLTCQKWAADFSPIPSKSVPPTDLPISAKDNFIFRVAQVKNWSHSSSLPPPVPLSHI